MRSRGETQYFLEIERIALDLHLSATLQRTVGLRSRAIEQHDIAALDDVTAMQKMVLLLRERLRRLEKKAPRRVAGVPVQKTSARHGDLDGAMLSRNK